MTSCWLFNGGSSVAEYCSCTFPSWFCHEMGVFLQYTFDVLSHSNSSKCCHQHSKPLTESRKRFNFFFIEHETTVAFLTPIQTTTLTKWNATQPARSSLVFWNVFAINCDLFKRSGVIKTCFYVHVIITGFCCVLSVGACLWWYNMVTFLMCENGRLGPLRENAKNLVWWWWWEERCLKKWL